MCRISVKNKAEETMGPLILLQCAENFHSNGPAVAQAIAHGGAYSVVGGGDSAAARFFDEKVSSKQIKPELRELVRNEVEKRQQGRMQGLKKE